MGTKRKRQVGFLLLLLLLNATLNSNGMNLTLAVVIIIAMYCCFQYTYSFRLIYTREDDVDTEHEMKCIRETSQYLVSITQITLLETAKLLNDKFNTVHYCTETVVWRSKHWIMSPMSVWTKYNMLSFMHTHIHALWTSLCYLKFWIIYAFLGLKYNILLYYLRNWYEKWILNFEWCISSSFEHINY